MSLNYVHIASIAQRGTSEEFDTTASQAAINSYKQYAGYSRRGGVTCGDRGLNCGGVPTVLPLDSETTALPCAIVPENFQVLMKISHWGFKIAAGTSYTNSIRFLNIDNVAGFEVNGPYTTDGRIEFSASHTRNVLFLQGNVGGWVGTMMDPPISGDITKDGMYLRLSKVGDDVFCKIWSVDIAEPADNPPYKITNASLRGTPWVLSLALSNWDAYRLGVIGICWSDEVETPIPLSAANKFKSYVSGTVKRPDGTAAANAVVSVTSCVGGSILGQTTCNNAGVFNCDLNHTPVGTVVNVNAFDGTTDPNGLQSDTISHVMTVDATVLDVQSHYTPLR